MSVEIHNLTGEPLIVAHEGRVEDVHEIQHDEKLVLDGFDPERMHYIIRPARNPQTPRDWRPKLRDEPDREDDDG